MKLPDLPNNIGQKRSLTGINGDHRSFTIIDEIPHVPRDNPEKVIYFQKLKFDGARDVEFRIGYYMIGKKPGRTKGRWVWAQFAPLIGGGDLKALIRKAEKKGWIEPST